MFIIHFLGCLTILGRSMVPPYLKNLIQKNLFRSVVSLDHLLEIQKDENKRHYFKQVKQKPALKLDKNKKKF